MSDNPTTDQPPTPPPADLPPAAVAAPRPPVPPTYAAQPRERNFSRGFGIGAGTGIGLGAALGITGLLSSLILAGGMAAAGASVAQLNAGTLQTLSTVWGNDAATAAETVRAIPITGPIMAGREDGFTFGSTTYGYEVAKTIDGIKTEDAAGLVLLLNTPGGTINGSRAIADSVERYQARTGKKVIAYVQGMSASGGMYAMAGADKIIADHGSLVGSIGVIFGPFTRYKDVVATSGSFAEAGVSTTGGITQEYLTQGEGKDIGNPFRDMTAKERSTLMTGLANEYGEFVNWVSKARGIPADTIRTDLGAYIYDGKTAIAKKLIDAQLGPDDAFRDVATQLGLDPAKARVAQAGEPGLFEQLLGAEARVFGYSAVAPGGGVRATSVLCTGAPQTFAFHGPTASACG